MAMWFAVESPKDIQMRVESPIRFGCALGDRDAQTLPKVGAVQGLQVQHPHPLVLLL